MSQEDLKAEFDEILKETVIPFFKEFGFKRKPPNFYRPINDIGQCFTVQRNPWNPHTDTVAFSFDLGFFNQEIYKIVTEKPQLIEFPRTTDCFIQNRLGTYSHGRDHWYRLARNVNKNEIKTQVENDLTNYLKPLFEEFTSLDSLKELVAKDERIVGPVFAPYYLIAFYMTTGQTGKGIQTIKEHYSKAHKPMTVTNTVIYPDGRREAKIQTSINQFYIEGIERLAKHYDVTLDKTPVTRTGKIS